MATRIETLARRHNVTNYINGSVLQSLNTDGAYLAPIVPVGSTLIKVWSYDLLSPFRIPNTKRALGGKANRVEFGGTDTDIGLDPNALDTGLDATITNDEELVMNLQSQVNLTTRLAGLAHNAAVVALIQAAMTTAGVTTTLDISDGDPVATINTLLKGILLSMGAGSPMARIRFLWGWNAAQKFLASADVIARVSGGADTDNPAVPTLSSLSGMFMWPGTEHRMSALIKDTSEQGATTAARSFVLDDEILIVGASDSPTKEDPSAFKTFWYGAAGMRTRYYPSEDKRVENFGLDWDFKVYAANPYASRRITVQA